MLSRSDEIGSGRIDSLLSAAKVARRYEHDGELASLVLGVIPVAGLVAEGARTLRESEYIAIRQLAALDRLDREKLLVSADRFVTDTTATSLSTTVRADLVSRFGIFGVRLATALIRGGVRSSSELAEAMVQQSGLVQLQQFVRTQFRTRASTFKVRGVLLALARLVRDSPRDGVQEIHAASERLSASAHGLRELSLIASARAHGLPLPAEDEEEALRIIGGQGTYAYLRLGMGEDADAAALQERTDAALAHWRTLAESPLTSSAAAGVCRVVMRSLEALAEETAPAPEASDSASEPGSEVAGADDALVAPADVVTPGGPGHGRGQDAAEESEKHKPRLSWKKKQKGLPAVADRHPLG